MSSAKTGDLEDFHALLDLVPVDAAAKAQLSVAMSGHGRLYHNVAHLAELWRGHRRHGAAENMFAPAVEPLIACTIAFHDSVYDPSRRDNERRSAAMWMRASKGAPMEPRDRAWVARTIRATHDHLGYKARLDIEGVGDDPKGAAEILRERARLWVLDLDLSPLGAAEPIFEHNTDLLRREDRCAADADWRARMLSFFERLARAPQIYRVPTLAEVYEAPARRNISRLLQRLSA